jgi:hypothetical protein
MGTNQTELEPVIIEILLDCQVRQFVASYLEPWMFQRTIYAHLVETLISDTFRNHVIDLKVLRLYMQSTYKDIYSDDWQVIEDIYTKAAPVSSEDIESVTSMIANFIKNVYYSGNGLVRQRGY